MGIKVGLDFDDTVAETNRALWRKLQMHDRQFPKIKELNWEKDTVCMSMEKLIGMPRDFFIDRVLDPLLYREDFNYTGIFPMRGAIEGLIILERLINWPNGLCIVSRRKRPDDIYGWIIEWYYFYNLGNRMPMISIYTAERTQEKLNLLKKFDNDFDFYVDDRPATADWLLANTNIYPIYIERPWNKDAPAHPTPGAAFKDEVPIRVKNWNELIKLLQFLKAKEEIWKRVKEWRAWVRSTSKPLQKNGNE